MREHILDRPVWTSLKTVHAGFSQGKDNALRFEPSIGPLTGIANESDEALGDVMEFANENGPIYVVEAEQFKLDRLVNSVSHEKAVQMVLNKNPELETISDEIEPLGEADVPDMVALAQLTKPGPFAERTHLLGDFFGIKADGQLVAMAGERLKQPGYTEVSGVCTHPDHQGKGYGRALCILVMNRIIERGETAYLHAYKTNVGAIGLYEQLGFEIRTHMDVICLDQSG